MACTFEVYRDGAAEYRWRLRDTNGKMIADSGEGYTTKAACLAGIQNVKDCSPGAQRHDLT